MQYRWLSPWINIHIRRSISWSHWSLQRNLLPLTRLRLFLPLNPHKFWVPCDPVMAGSSVYLPHLQIRPLRGLSLNHCPPSCTVIPSSLIFVIELTTIWNYILGLLVNFYVVSFKSHVSSMKIKYWAFTKGNILVMLFFLN